MSHLGALESDAFHDIFIVGESVVNFTWKIEREYLDVDLFKRVRFDVLINLAHYLRGEEQKGKGEEYF